MRANPVTVGANSKAGSGTGCVPGQDTDDSITVHKVTSEDIPGHIFIVGWAPELQQNPMVYVFFDAGAVLDCSGNSVVGMVDTDSNFVVTEQVVVPKGTLTFRVGEGSTPTIIVISFSAACGEKCLVQATQRLG